MLRHVYTLLFYLLLPLAVARLLWRSRAEPLYRATIAERFGYGAPDGGTGMVWVHAVSAGETNAAAPLVERLLAGSLPVIVTTMTPTGRARVRALFGDRVSHVWAPWDLPRAVRRFMDRVRPRLLIIVDTELWPNILNEARRRGIPTALVNARLSARSAKRYGYVRPLTREMLEGLDVVACQTEAQGRRFVDLGLSPSRLNVTGSIKFDIALPADLPGRSEALRQRIGDRRVVLGASTHAGEEAAMLEVLHRIDDPAALLVLAPRHPNRNLEVLTLCRENGFRVVRHSDGDAVDPRDQVLLLDTMGELIYFYQVAEVAFVGGSLVPVGGHNPMEPASTGTPIVMGEHLFNIDEIANRFEEAGAMRVVRGSESLADVIGALYADEEARHSMVSAADNVMEENRGALDRTMELLVRLMD